MGNQKARELQFARIDARATDASGTRPATRHTQSRREKYESSGFCGHLCGVIKVVLSIAFPAEIQPVVGDQIRHTCWLRTCRFWKAGLSGVSRDTSPNRKTSRSGARDNFRFTVQTERCLSEQAVLFAGSARNEVRGGPIDCGGVRGGT